MLPASVGSAHLRQVCGRLHSNTTPTVSRSTRVRACNGLCMLLSTLPHGGIYNVRALIYN